MRNSDMRRVWFLVACGCGLAVAGCISHTRPESAALPQPWPQAPNLTSYAKGDPDDPSIGGDILKDYTPAQLAAARAAATAPPSDPEKH